MSPNRRIHVEQIQDVAGATRWVSLASVCVPVDHPGLVAGPVEEVVHQLSGLQRAAEYAHFVAEVDGVDVAYGTARLPLHDNLTAATVSMSVVPAHRRTGVGMAIAKEIIALLRQRGRTIAQWTVGSPLGHESAGEAFSRVLGAQRGLSRFRRELDLTKVDDGALDATAAAHVAGRDGDYEVITWVDRSPDALVDGVARLVGRMSTDAPTGDLTSQPEEWDADRWREKEDDARRSGRRRLAAGALDRHGRLAAFTDIGVYVHEPSTGEQWNTIVDPDHRGHRLGLAIKIANLRQLRATLPATGRLETWNAVENTRMIAINELLGFRLVERVDEFELKL